MKRGFTIVELLIYMVIMSALLTVLGRILITTLDLQTESESTSMVETDGRFLLSRLSYDLHRASSIASPTSAGQTAASLGLTIDGQTFTYAVTNSALQLTTPSGSSPLTSPDVAMTNFSVTRLGNPGGKPTVQINFTISHGQETRNYQTAVGLRY